MDGTSGHMRRENDPCAAHSPVFIRYPSQILTHLGYKRKPSRRDFHIITEVLDSFVYMCGLYDDNDKKHAEICVAIYALFMVHRGENVILPFHS